MTIVEEEAEGEEQAGKHEPTILSKCNTQDDIQVIVRVSLGESYVVRSPFESLLHPLIGFQRLNWSSPMCWQIIIS